MNPSKRPVSKTRSTGTVSRVLPVEAAAAFGTITDLARLPEWNARMTEVLELPDRLEPGAQWVVGFQVFERRWRSRSRVESIDVGALRFAHRTQTDDGNPSFADWRWEVEPLQRGCRVTVSWELHPATFWRRAVLARVRNHQLARTEVPASLAALADVVRTRTATPSNATSPLSGH
jgi:polyketide cyclase/dehydrase/lipid transport protein